MGPMVVSHQRELMNFCEKFSGLYLNLLRYIQQAENRVMFVASLQTVQNKADEVYLFVQKLLAALVFSIGNRQMFEGMKLVGGLKMNRKLLQLTEDRRNSHLYEVVLW
jgi:hypothetical protein